MSSLSFIETPLQGLKAVERSMHKDERGFLSRLFCCEELARAGSPFSIKQINHTHTNKKGTIRGMHFQHAPHTESKIVSCIRGEIWDVAVDLRSDSPTFLHWHGELLTEANCRSLLIPDGFAHGFQTLTDGVELIYLHSASYQPASEDGLNPLDDKLSINWPEVITLISDRDKLHPDIGNTFKGVHV